MTTSVFHPGESEVQERLHVREQVERFGPRMMRDSMPDQHRRFFAGQPFVVVGSLDATGRPWASLVTGVPGFASSPDARTLLIDGAIAAGDPLAANLHAGAPVGLLGIQPETRRRNRVNGVVRDTDGRGFVVGVAQSFGNCPRYIQARIPRFRRDPMTPSGHSVAKTSSLLDAKSLALVAAADTFFIASASRNAVTPTMSEGVDVSHRGGKPGFVRAASNGSTTTLTFPDYDGNNMFNTLGNLQANPRAGLVFPSFETGDVLTLTGSTEIVWDGPEVSTFDGALRLVRFHVEEGALLTDALPFEWSPAELAPEFDEGA